MPKHTTLRLILGDQLNENHSWFKHPDKNVTYVLMEVREETDYVTHHIQKVAAFFAALRVRGVSCWSMMRYSQPTDREVP